MKSLRSSLIAAERLVRASARPPGVEAHSGDSASTMYRYVTIAVIAALAVTNVLTWQALSAERSHWVAAERRVTIDSSATKTFQHSAAAAAMQRLINQTVTRATLLPSAAHGTQAASGSAAVVLNGAELSKKLADPAAREALRSQQKGAVLQLYGELLKRWHLNGASAGSVLDALADHELQQLVSVLAPGAAGTDAIGGNAADNDAVRATLDAKQLQELRAYDETLPDRMAIQPLLSELELAQTPLSADNAEQLINAAHDERVAIPQPQPPDSQATSAYLQSLKDWQVNLDQRIRDRADAFLPADVVNRLESLQSGRRTASSVFASVQPIAAPSTNAGSRP